MLRVIVLLFTLFVCSPLKADKTTNCEELKGSIAALRLNLNQNPRNASQYKARWFSVGAVLHLFLVKFPEGVTNVCISAGKTLAQASIFKKYVLALSGAGDWTFQDHTELIQTSKDLAKLAPAISFETVMPGGTMILAAILSSPEAKSMVLPRAFSEKRPRLKFFEDFERRWFPASANIGLALTTDPTNDQEALKPGTVSALQTLDTIIHSDLATLNDDEIETIKKFMEDFTAVD